MPQASKACNLKASAAPKIDPVQRLKTCSQATSQWNGVPSAFRFVMVIAVVLIFVALRDDELPPRAP